MLVAVLVFSILLNFLVDFLYFSSILSDFILYNPICIELKGSVIFIQAFVIFFLWIEIKVF
jgi:hypothetical protein